jgi:hypothetical protein
MTYQVGDQLVSRWEGSSLRRGEVVDVGQRWKGTTAMWATVRGITHAGEEETITRPFDVVERFYEVVERGTTVGGAVENLSPGDTVLHVNDEVKVLAVHKDKLWVECSNGYDYTVHKGKVSRALPELWFNVYTGHGGRGYPSRQEADDAWGPAARTGERIGVLHLKADGTTEMEKP